jgi:hypothetical protein
LASDWQLSRLSRPASLHGMSKGGKVVKNPPSDVSPIIKEGWLLKKSKKGGLRKKNKRYFVIQDGLFIYSEARGSPVLKAIGNL